MIRFNHKGDWNKTINFLKKSKNIINPKKLDKYGKAGVDALMSATPIDTGITASSWYYKIESDKDVIKIGFYNSNNQNGIPIAIIIQYGHGTGTGGWVEGRDYINPAIRPVFDQMLNTLWKEVTKN